MTIEEYNSLVFEVKKVKCDGKANPHDFCLLRHSDIIYVEHVDKLIHPVTMVSKPIKYYVTESNLFDVFHDTHVRLGHGGRNKMMYNLNSGYKNITQKQVTLFLHYCDVCAMKKME